MQVRTTCNAVDTHRWMALRAVCAGSVGCKMTAFAVELSDAFVVMDDPTPGAPTETLNLQRDSLHASAVTVQRLLEDLVWLANRARDCREQGAALPYSYCDLVPAFDALRNVAGQIREAQAMEG